jgi:hypothetical protein
MSFGGERYRWTGEGLRGGVDKHSRRNKGRVSKTAEKKA